MCLLPVRIPPCTTTSGRPLALSRTSSLEKETNTCGFGHVINTCHSRPPSSLPHGPCRAAVDNRPPRRVVAEVRGQKQPVARASLRVGGAGRLVPEPLKLALPLCSNLVTPQVGFCVAVARPPRATLRPGFTDTLLKYNANSGNQPHTPRD